MQVIASFDLGIKNLSYCVASFDASGTFLRIDRWANLNLLAGGADSQTQTRCACGGPASYSDGLTLLCKKCAKKSAKPPLELVETTAPAWRAFAAKLGIDCKKLSKAQVQEKVGVFRLLPYKAPKAKGVTLQTLLAAMEVCLSTEIEYLAPASRIRIENQPSEFAPHMKSIQIILFTLLDHRLRTEKGWTGTMEFVNAGVKTKGLDAGTGKGAKRSRKLASIAKVVGLVTAGAPSWLPWWNSQAKQDDLADAFLMCVDAV